MSIVERRQIEINPDAGGSISLERAGNVVQITRTVYYANFTGDACPIELETADRLALIDFLNMGEYRRLGPGESR